MRRLLPFLLLLAVLFNTAVGLPLHERAHLAAGTAAAQTATAAQAGEAADNRQEDTHAACATCVALAQAAQAWLPQPPALPAPAADVRCEGEAPASPAPRLSARWSFASRDPPSRA